MSGKVIPLRTGDYLQERNRLLLANCNRAEVYARRSYAGAASDSAGGADLRDDGYQ